MDQRRVELGQRLRTVLGNNNVYYQKPRNDKLSYPCCIYALDNIITHYADNAVYTKTNRYSVTFITTDPDNDYFGAMLSALNYVKFDRRFISDNLYHIIYTVYY